VSSESSSLEEAQRLREKYPQMGVAALDAADAHGVEVSRVEGLLQSSLAEPALLSGKTLD